ncbi:hypothetical protein BHF15_16400 [Escherichia coli]|nr:hypothetical protein BHF15_16400 [Escherichia coli]
MHQPPVRFTYRLLSYLISTIIAGQPLLPAVGAVITPQNGTGMDKAANGVPVVNIATPNGAGISHNRFTDYNVGKEGLILNNATGKLNPTQLGGLIQNNPNLKAGGEAKGIINEVTGGNRSLLQGYTEVAGKAANVMVANPYGITCDGCGFINTPHATLTTGRPVMNADGSLQALEVTEGSITINGAGLDGTRSDAVSIIARATEVNAALHAKDLTVTAGANRVTADGRVSALKGEGDVPKVAVDTGALGGMYARRIHLTSTESGVGVNLGNLYARDGDITLDASGRLTVNNSLATGAVTAKGQGVTLTGDHKAGGNLSVSSRSDIVLSNGTLNSDKNLSLTAGGRITQQNEKLTAGRDVTLAAKNITQDTASQINAARDIVTVASDTLTTQGQIPRSAQAMWALGAGANAGIGSMVDSSVDPENAIIAGWVNVITMGQGWKGTVGWNAAGGAFGNWLDGKDPLSGAAMSGGTSAIGYGVGKVVQGPLEKVINPNWKNWEWLNVGMGISKPLPLNPTPGIAGNIGSSIGSEGSGAIIQEQLKNQQEKK